MTGEYSVEACGRHLEAKLPFFTPLKKVVGKRKELSEPDQEWVDRPCGETYTIYERKFLRRNVPLLTLTSDSRGQQLEVHESYIWGAVCLILQGTKWKKLLCLNDL